MDQDQTLLAEARARFDRAAAAAEPRRREAQEDYRMAAGRHWPEAVRAAREAESRPVITINRLPQFVRRVVGELRQATPGITVRPVDDRADPATAAALTGLIRHIEAQCDARQAYLMAAEHAAIAGLGHVRLTTRWEDGASFRQELAVAAIADPFAVWWDPEASLPGFADAAFCFVTERVTAERARSLCPDLPPGDPGFAAPADEGTRRLGEGAGGGEGLRLAEYWTRTAEVRRLALLPDGSVRDVTELSAAARRRLAPVRERDALQPRVRMALLAGRRVLARHDWPGSAIPIVPVLGEVLPGPDGPILHGIVRHARDAQRLYNYWRTTMAEQVALQPKAPFLMTPQQIRGHEGRWREANLANFPYLLYNPDPTAPVPQRQAPPLPSAGHAQEVALAADDLKATTGIYDAALGAPSNETSGTAIRRRQEQVGLSTLVYADHLGQAVRQVGRLLLDLIPRVYESGRIVRVLGPDGAASLVRLGAGGPDPTVGRYDVTIDSGPSYASRRQEMAEGLVRLVQSNPALWDVAGDLLVRALDWPGADELARRLSARAGGADGAG